MSVDVSTTVTIDRPVALVAGYAADPDHAPDWYVNISSAEWRSPPPLAVGTLVIFHARFLGRPLTYTYRVVELVPSQRLVMRTADGPFPMETTYEWIAQDEGRSTRMTLRNRGEPAGFARVVAPLVGPAMQRANAADLRLLKQLLESEPPPAH
jgi:uncharacterized protein YndB with AHSA1/START domain